MDIYILLNMIMEIQEQIKDLHKCIHKWIKMLSVTEF